MSENAPVRIVLTPEQREQVRRTSGQDIEAILLEEDGTAKEDAPIHARWRLSVATGIPRQGWVEDEKDPKKPA